MSNTYLDLVAEMKAWEKASDNDSKKLPSGGISSEWTCFVDRINELESTIRKAIKKLEGPGMPYRAREAIEILTEAVDED